MKTGPRKWDLRVELIEILNGITMATIGAIRANATEPLWITKIVRVHAAPPFDARRHAASPLFRSATAQ